MSKRQCIAFTKAGKPCQGGAKEGESFCGPHFDQSVSKIERVLEKKTTPTEEEMTMEEHDQQFWDEIRENFDLVISGTGSRQLQLRPEDAKRVLAQLRKRLKEFKDSGNNIIVMSGGAEGFDAALMKAAHLEGIPYIMAMPSKDYGNYYWKNNSVTKRDRSEAFEKYKDEAYRVINVCPDHKGFEPKRPGKANFDRNQYMVDHADWFFYYDRNSRGTKDCVARIEKAGKLMEEVS